MVIILDSTNFYVTTIFICSFYINTNGAVVRMGAVVVPLLYWDMNLKNGTKKIALKFFGHQVSEYLNEGSDQ